MPVGLYIGRESLRESKEYDARVEKAVTEYLVKELLTKGN